jgi:hypothetical protein
MINRDYDGSIIRWMSNCVTRGSHRFNSGDVCMDCGAPQRGPAVTIVRGGPRRKKAK